MKQSQIRNFAIIAHIDHGKSTLADRMLELTGTVTKAEKQTLDSNPIEQERGITIKLAPVRLEYHLDKVKSKSEKVKVKESATHLKKNSESRIQNIEILKQVQNDDKHNLETLKLRNLETYILNLIDTPGHVDFSYEVSRALAACEGAILLVDATQGIQAQTLAHYREAHKLGLKLIPVLNKIDLDSAQIEETKLQMMETFGFEEEEFLAVSAKTGEGVEELLKAVIERVPAPSGKEEGALRGLVFNSQFDKHLGVVAWMKIVDGKISSGENVKFLGTGVDAVAIKVNYFQILNSKNQISNTQIKNKILSTGEVGKVVLSLKDPTKIQIGDTVTAREAKEVKPLPGYNPPKPMIFVSLYPMDQGEYQELGEALDKLRLLDSSLDITPESSPMLGNGYRVGFLGVLHAEIVQERLEREFDLEVMGTQPSVVYKIRRRVD